MKKIEINSEFNSYSSVLTCVLGSQIVDTVVTKSKRKRLISVQTVCKGYQQMTKNLLEDKELIKTHLSHNM